jgi:hypothetical protein
MADCTLIIDVVSEQSIRTLLGQVEKPCVCVPDASASNIVSSLSECLDAGHPRTDAWFDLFGKSLGTRLFQDDLSDVLQDAFRMVRDSQDRVRVLLRFGKEAAALAKLPWELAKYRQEYLGVRGNLTLARLMTVDKDRRRVPPAAPSFRALIVEGGPNLGADDLERNLQRLNIKVTRWDAERYFERKHDPITDAGAFDVIHFIGHGVALGDRTALSFQVGSDGRKVEPAEAFGLFAAGRASVVVLQACSSAAGDFTALPPGDVLAKGVPAVIAMQYPILASRGNEFSIAMYTHLAARRPVDVSVQCAREALFTMRVSHGPTFGIPVLYLADPEPITIAPTATLTDSPSSQQEEIRRPAAPAAQVLATQPREALKPLIPTVALRPAADGLSVTDLRAQLGDE